MGRICHCGEYIFWPTLAILIINFGCVTEISPNIFLADISDTFHQFSVCHRHCSEYILWPTLEILFINFGCVPDIAPNKFSGVHWRYFSSFSVLSRTLLRIHFLAYIGDTFNQFRVCHRQCSGYISWPTLAIFS